MHPHSIPENSISNKQQLQILLVPYRLMFYWMPVVSANYFPTISYFKNRKSAGCLFEKEDICHWHPLFFFFTIFVSCFAGLGNFIGFARHEFQRFLF
jgi:hypothetical protein